MRLYQILQLLGQRIHPGRPPFIFLQLREHGSRAMLPVISFQRGQVHLVTLPCQQQRGVPQALQNPRRNGGLLFYLFQPLLQRNEKTRKVSAVYRGHVGRRQDAQCFGVVPVI